MLNANLFGEELKNYGFKFYSGVPCSFLKDLINYAINDCFYIMAANEGDAVAICAGAYLGGRKSVVLMQNSGLTNATSPLSSLNYVFRLPVLGFVTFRGGEGITDEPQHELIGKITTSMLDLMQIKWEYLSNNNNEAKKQLEKANDYIENNQTFFFIVRKGTFEKEKLIKQSLNIVSNQNKITKTKEDSYPKRIDVLEKVNLLKNKNTILLTATGYTGRELYEIEDEENNFYMVGSMGCASSIGLGLSLVKNDKDIIVIDGDGALLMRMGSMGTNAYYNPENMLHVLLDNNAHFSTGGQATVSHIVDFVNIAASVGYQNAIYAHNLEEFGHYIKEWKISKGLTFLYLKVSKCTKENLARPKIMPYEVKERLMNFLRKNND